ncbi:AEC family transporter [Halobaculum sp. CBA1158]|uniref:AEC family transporter n=1 Tax=Halobaculum sp. CBA1158 TaxID=2904243 RepID=UPI001F1761A4|nr:AEC family transporter [Halobaculum sp. CBA1158]UIO98474.1 AEC family transporter [Halobaculum sp. CBA1158]
MSVASNLAYMLVLLAAGVAGRRVGLLTPSRRDALTDAAFLVALPALVYTSTFAQPLGDVLSVGLVGGVVVVVAVGVAVSLLVHRRRKPAAVRSVAVVQSYHTNLGFLGLPIVAATFGAGAVEAGKASVVLGTGALVQVPATVTLLGVINGGDTDLVGELRGLAGNPVLAALAAGLLSAAVGWSPPGLAVSGLGVLADLALPVALLGVGASLSLEATDLDLPTLGTVAAVKLLAMPVVALAVFTALGGDAATVRTGVVMFAMPTAVSTFVYATALGGDPDLASVTVFATTVASVATLVPVLWLVGVGG